MHEVFLLLGSNQGDRSKYLAEAIRMLGQLGEIHARSSVYETEAWGKTDQPAFLNQSVGLKTNLAPELLLQSILEIELTLGRKRQERYGPRTIDIDILLYDALIHRSQTLIIPHPELHNRRFALAALAEIAPNWVHPVLQLTITQLLEECGDPLDVKRID